MWKAVSGSPSASECADVCSQSSLESQVMLTIIPSASSAAPVQFSTPLLAVLAQQMNLPDAAVDFADTAAKAMRTLHAYQDGMLVSLIAMRRPLVCKLAIRLLMLLKVPLAALRRGGVEELPDWWDQRIPCQLPEVVRDTVLQSMVDMLCRQVHAVTYHDCCACENVQRR